MKEIEAFKEGARLFCKDAGYADDETELMVEAAVQILEKEAISAAKGLSKEQRSETASAARRGEDIGKPGKRFKEVAEKARKGGARDPEAVAAAAMWKAKAKKAG